MRKHLVDSYKWFIRMTPLKSVQARLGFSDDTKLLIIHADDMGLSSSENQATLKAMETGIVNSGSAMVLSSHFDQIVDYSAVNPAADIGIHLTLTNEWNTIKVKPVLPPDDVRSIVDTAGSLQPSKRLISETAVPDEVDKEFRAQIDRAIGNGLDLTHIDSHMYVAFANRKIIKAYRSLSRDYKLPVLLTYDLPVNTWLFNRNIVVDNLYCARPEDFNNGFRDYYNKVLKSITPGLNVILVHLAFDNEEMHKLTGDQRDFGSAWRQADYDYFTGDECRLLIAENDIKLITWREIRDKLYRK